MKLLIKLFLIYIIIKLINSRCKSNSNTIEDFIEKIFKNTDLNKNDSLSIKEIINNFDTDKRTITSEIFLASIIDHDLKHKTNILKDNKISLNELKKFSESDNKLDLWDDNFVFGWGDKRCSLEVKDEYANNLLKKARTIIRENFTNQDVSK